MRIYQRGIILRGRELGIAATASREEWWRERPARVEFEIVLAAIHKTMRDAAPVIG
jgi:hypothetical protein